MKHYCENCNWTGEDVLDIDDVLERLSPGDIFPSGQCPQCGALCHPEDQREVIIGSGGGHTPGPWFVSSNRPLEEKDEFGVEKLDRIKAIGGKAVAFISDYAYPIHEENANAHLISAAPELLTALEECCRELMAHEAVSNVLREEKTPFLPKPPPSKAKTMSEAAIRKAYGLS